MEFNRRDEQSVIITSDLSSFEEEEREVGDASTTTLTQDVSVNNLATGEVRTPAASNPPNFYSSEPATGRLSLSQPVLPINSTPTTRVATISTGNRCSPLGETPRPYKKLLAQTLEENKYLSEEITVLKTKLHAEQYKVAESTCLQHRKVQDILDEYYSLKLSKFDLAEERKQMAQELEQYKERVRELEAEIAMIDDLSIDFLKGYDRHRTIRSEGDIVSEELRGRLVAVEKENNALRQKIDKQKKDFEEKLTMFSGTLSQSKTFTVGRGCDVETLLQRIEHLEGCLRVKDEESGTRDTAGIERSGGDAVVAEVPASLERIDVTQQKSMVRQKRAATLKIKTLAEPKLKGKLRRPSNNN